MDPEYGEHYRGLYERHWWWRARTEFIVETLRRYSLPRGPSNILDIGCGDGLFFDRLTEFGEVEGVEPFAELVDPANPYRDRIYTVPFDEAFRPGKEYSLILMLDVLEHLEKPNAALRHVSALLKPGGRLVVTVPSFKALWTNHDVLNHHFTRYTKSSFRDVLRGTGLQITEERYLYHWTCPLKLGVRVAESFLRIRPKPPKIPSALINEVLYRVSRLEQKTLTSLPMPFGSSLLVVATARRTATEADNTAAAGHLLTCPP